MKEATYLFVGVGEGDLHQQACYGISDMRQAYLDLVLGGDLDAQYGDELEAFMRKVSDPEEWYGPIFEQDIGETGRVLIVRVDVELKAP